MDSSYWHKQAQGKPLFPDLLWSRPENRTQAGKLLIIGGNGYEFKAPANAYGDALNAGIGTAKVLLPDSMQKVVRDIFPEAEFAPSTPSGSFARTTLAQALELATWADGVLIAGDMGRNSETAVLLESFAKKYDGPLIITKDAVDYCLSTPTGCLERPDTLAVITIAQLQKLATSARSTLAFTFDTDMLRMVQSLHEFTNQYPLAIITKHLDTMFVAHGGKVSTTKLAEPFEQWRTHTAAHAATWLIQNPTKPYEALSTSLVG